MILKHLVIVVLFGVCTVSAVNKCCTGSLNLLGDKKCIDGKNITGIPCTRRYMLNPEDANQFFTVDADQNLVEDGDLLVPVDKYCLTKETPNGPDVALVCFPEKPSNYIGDSEETYVFRAACALISVIFLIATIIVYSLVPSLRDLQGKCLLNSITALALAMLFLCIMQFGVTIPNTLCEIVGYVTFAAFLATFTWLNTISFHIWRTTVMPTALGTNKQWYLLYCVYAYGIPLIIILIAVIAHHAPGDHIKPRIGEYACWFSDRDATWAYFYGPIAFLLIINVILFVWTVKKLWKDMKGCNNSVKIKSMKYKCLLYIKLFFIMGLSWIFEVVSFAFQNQQNFLDYIWLVTDFINALQGVLIFLILVAFRKRALRGLAKRGLCCIHLPQQWKTLQDEECDEIVEEEQLAKDNVVPQEQVYKPKETQAVV